MSKPTCEAVSARLPALVSWAASMCRNPWPCDCQRGDTAAPETREGEFIGIIDDIARAWRLRRSNARVQAIMGHDTATDIP